MASELAWWAKCRVLRTPSCPGFHADCPPFRQRSRNVSAEEFGSFAAERDRVSRAALARGHGGATRAHDCSRESVSRATRAAGSRFSRRASATPASRSAPSSPTAFISRSRHNSTCCSPFSSGVSQPLAFGAITLASLAGGFVGYTFARRLARIEILARRLERSRSVATRAFSRFGYRGAVVAGLLPVPLFGALLFGGTTGCSHEPVSGVHAVPNPAPRRLLLPRTSRLVGVVPAALRLDSALHHSVSTSN